MKNLITAYPRPGRELRGKAFQLTEKVLSALSMILLGIYRTVGTTHLGGSCRFEPSCSDFAQSCFRRFGFFEALPMVIKRLLKCQPFGPWGFDPVPNPKGKARAAE